MLREGRSMVGSQLRFWALLSEGGATVPESQLVPDVVWYNAECAWSSDERFDGVAVNNEAYDRYWTEAEKSAYLDNLYAIKREAARQDAALGILDAHYSVGWLWGKDDNLQDIYVTWNGVNQPIMRHFVDIFDSVDVQV